MKIELRHQEGMQVIVLHGEIDMHSATGLRERLLAALQNPTGLVVDMSDVGFIDSSGIAILVEGYKRAKQHSQAFALAGVRTAPMQVLQLTRLDNVFPLFADVASAVKSAVDG
jgi:anti-sigma B factor antagonist